MSGEVTRRKGGGVTAADLKRQALNLATRMFGDEGAAVVRMGLERLEVEHQFKLRQAAKHVH